MIKIAWLLTLMLVAGNLCNYVRAGDAPPDFTPQVGFGGDSEGHGSLTLLLGKPRGFVVKSHGTQQVDGSFRLDQSITFEGKPPQERVWILSSTGQDSYSATLSDAAGLVKGVTEGPRLSLRYRIKGPLFMVQELTLSADGRTIDNVGTIRLLGIPVGRLHETITHK